MGSLVGVRLHRCSASRGKEVNVRSQTLILRAKGSERESERVFPRTVRVWPPARTHNPRGAFSPHAT